MMNPICTLSGVGAAAALEPRHTGDQTTGARRW
jgi:hypothetical protein